MNIKCDLAIKSKRILTPNGIIDGVLLISDGKIIYLGGEDSAYTATKRIDAGNNVVMPGIIDPHVHINEPGRTEWEGFDTATRSAAAGGITTLIDMPLNSAPVSTTAENLRLKIEAAKKNAHVNCGFWGGVVPDNYDDLEDLLHSGVFGLKAFLTHSGIDDFPATSVDQLRKVLLLLKDFGLPLLVHCELDEDHPGISELKNNPTNYQAYLKSRPKSWENNAIKAMIDLCRETEARVHIVHLSSADMIPEIRKAKAEGLPLTVETAPHYLVFNAEEINDSATAYKCAPPIRERENNEKLWEALKEGVIDFIATDHSPAPPDMKEIESGDFYKAWGGIAGLQFSLPAIWTASSRYNFSIADLSKWMSYNPARFLSIDSSVGRLKSGANADVVIWDPEKEISLDENNIHHRHKLTPYSGMKLFGEVKQTIVNGKLAYDSGAFIDLNAGEILES